MAGDGLVGHVLVGKREKNLLMARGGASEATDKRKRNQWVMEVLVTY